MVMIMNSLRSMTLKRALPASSSIGRALYLCVIHEQPRQVQQRREPAHDADDVKRLQPEHAADSRARGAIGMLAQFAHHQRAERGDVIGTRIERRRCSDTARRPPPGTTSRFSMPISSSVSRQSAAKPGQMTLTLFTPRARQLREHLAGVRLQPARAPEARLEGHAPRICGEAEPLREQARGALALIAIGIAQRDETLGHSVKRHEQVARGAVLAPMFLHARRQRFDVRRDRRDSRTRNAAPAPGAAAQRGAHLVEHGAGRSRRNTAETSGSTRIPSAPALRSECDGLAARVAPPV